MYLSLALKNMHSVEETIISGLYHRAEELQLPLVEHNMKIFYYTRSSFLKNWCEMMGSENIVWWILPLPYFKKQNHNLASNEPDDLRALQYMRLDRESCRSLVSCEYQVENHYRYQRSFYHYNSVTKTTTLYRDAVL